jgi:hypothetical protein
MNLKQELKVFNVQNITESNLQRNSMEKTSVPRIIVLKIQKDPSTTT